MARILYGFHTCQKKQITSFDLRSWISGFFRTLSSLLYQLFTLSASFGVILETPNCRLQSQWFLSKLALFGCVQRNPNKSTNTTLFALLWVSVQRISKQLPHLQIWRTEPWNLQLATKRGRMNTWELPKLEHSHSTIWIEDGHFTGFYSLFWTYRATLLYLKE